MPEYRCTRNKPYRDDPDADIPGRDDLSARQGYYIRAKSRKEALAQMAEKFPNDGDYGFTAVYHKD